MSCHCFGNAGRLAALVPANGEGQERRDAFRAGEAAQSDNGLAAQR